MKFAAAAMVVLATTFIQSSTALALPLNGKAVMKRLLARQNYKITYVTETANASPTASDSVVYETVYVTVGADGSPVDQPTATLDAVATSAITAMATTTSDSSSTAHSRTRRSRTSQPTQSAASASPATSSTSSSSAGGDWQNQVLAAHNQYRSKHSAGALTWDDTLASYAQQHASSCAFQHTGGPYGENLAAGYSSGSSSVDAWYAEGAQYNYADGSFSDATGHFTQVVWVGSQSVGCAWVSCNGQDGTPGEVSFQVIS